MSTVDVSPESLREAGRQTVEAAAPLGSIAPSSSVHVNPLTGTAQPVANGETVNVAGIGSGMPGEGHTAISTAGFPPGAQAQQALQGAIQRFATVPTDTVANCLALSSALHVVADVYTTADHENAMKFAFLEPGAKKPEGLPFYVDPKRTIRDPGGESENGRQTGEGKAPAGTDRKGSGDGGRSAGPRTEQRSIRAYGVGGRSRRDETRHYDKDGNLVRVDVAEHDTDGAARYYSLTQNENGGWEPSKEFSVPPQPGPGDPASIATSQAEQAKKYLEHVESGL